MTVDLGWRSTVVLVAQSHENHKKLTGQSSRGQLWFLFLLVRPETQSGGGSLGSIPEIDIQRNHSLPQIRHGKPQR
jgi:hypothetical protein